MENTDYNKTFSRRRGEQDQGGDGHHRHPRAQRDRGGVHGRATNLSLLASPSLHRNYLCLSLLIYNLLQREKEGDSLRQVRHEAE